MAETALTHLAEKLSLSPEHVRLASLYSTGDSTHFGQVLEPVCPLRDMWGALCAAANVEYVCGSVYLPIYNSLNRFLSLLYTSLFPSSSFSMCVSMHSKEDSTHFGQVLEPVCPLRDMWGALCTAVELQVCVWFPCNP